MSKGAHKSKRLAEKLEASRQARGCQRCPEATRKATGYRLQKPKASRKARGQTQQHRADASVKVLSTSIADGGKNGRQFHNLEHPMTRIDDGCTDLSLCSRSEEAPEGQN